MLNTLILALQEAPNPEAAAASLMGLGCVVLGAICLFALAILALLIYCWWRICAKAGYNGAMALLMLVPLGNLILILILAFGDWPILKDRPEA
jgi:hypothetical protein